MKINIEKYLKIIRWLVLILFITAIVITLFNFYLIKGTYDFIFQYLITNIGLNVWLVRIISIAFSLLVLIYGLKWFWRAISPSPLIKTHERNKALVGLGALFVLFCLMMWFFTKDEVYNKIGEAQKCYAATPYGYEYVDCSYNKHPIYGTEVKPVTSEIVRIIENKDIPEVSRIIPDKNYRFFSPDGQPLLYYFKYPNGKLEFFSQSGKHPQFNEDLKPITSEIVRQLFEYFDNGQDSMVITNRFKINSNTKEEFDSELKKRNSEKQIEKDDFSSYVNSSISNSSSVTDVSVTILDDGGNISTSVSSSIANIYNQNGTKSNTNLFRSSFIHSSGFQELFEGDSGIITKLKLSNNTDYLALGKINFSMQKGTLVEGTIICTATITMVIISANAKTISKSFSFSVNGNGVTESQAKEYAIQKLVNIYHNEHSSI